MVEGPITPTRVREFFREQYQRAFRHDHWHVGVVDAPIEAFLEPDARFGVRWLPLPGFGRYYADPFGRTGPHGTDLLFEEFDFRTNRGAVVWSREDGDGTFSRPEPVIELPHHVSYPFLFERQGTVYCIPETAHAREVALYRAVEFPRRWTKVVTLLNGVAGVDSTILEHDGRLWLLCTDLDDGPFSKLRIWYAEDLLGPWRAHPANPVKRDIRTARPAGTPFRVRGRLYRPAQDSSRTYGGSLALNEIVCLTPSEFREETVARVGPFRDGPHAHGIHTLSSLGDRTLVDGKRFAFNPRAMVRNLAGPLGNWGSHLLRAA